MLENWGGMTKAQDDSTTIDEAIASAILAHEEDSESHMGAGESIENHRINEVIDHPAQSIVPDKFNADQPVMQNFFVNPSDYLEEGNVGQNGGGVVWVGNSNNSPVSSAIWVPLPFISNKFFPENDILVDFSLRPIRGGSTYYTRVLIGDTLSGFGFEISNNSLRLILAVEDTQTYSSNISFSWGSAYSFRLFLDIASGLLKLYINGGLVLTLAITGSGSQIYEETLNLKSSCGNPGSVTVELSMLRAYYKI